MVDISPTPAFSILISTEAVDIFSLGSVFYTVMTGHWPYKSPGRFRSVAEKNEYEDRVESLFGCWIGLYDDVVSLIRDQSLYLGAIGTSVDGHDIA
ncbi:hypothetical protein N7475_002343 [Penicillium sp. IBT 31633x]|nr:hypothetical protein N7475_002343 [Penicillium sp. IBT 31633x]